MNRFKLSRWVKGSEKSRRKRQELVDESRHVRHRPHRYWSR